MFHASTHDDKKKIFVCETEYGRFWFVWWFIEIFRIVVYERQKKICLLLWKKNTKKIIEIIHIHDDDRVKKKSFFFAKWLIRSASCYWMDRKFGDYWNVLIALLNYRDNAWMKQTNKVQTFHQASLFFLFFVPRESQLRNVWCFILWGLLKSINCIVHFTCELFFFLSDIKPHYIVVHFSKLHFNNTIKKKNFWRKRKHLKSSKSYQVLTHEIEIIFFFILFFFLVLTML